MLSPPLFCSIVLGLIFVNIFVIGNTKNKLIRSTSSSRAFQLSSSPSWEKFVHEEFVKLMHEETLEDVEPLEESNAFWHALQKQYQVSKLLAQ